LNPDARRSFFWPALLLICALAAAQAAWLRAAHDLSIDEPFTANAVALGWTQLTGVFADDNVPLHYVLLKAWTAVVGDSAFALRGLSVLAFTLAVLVTGLAGRAAGGSGAGLLASLLVATSTSVGLLHAATARAYALLGLIAALGVWIGVLLVDAHARGTPGSAAAASPHAGHRLWLAASLAGVTALGLFAHPLFLFFAVALATAAAAASDRHRALALAAPAAGVLVYLVSWWPVLAQTLRLPATSWMARPALVDLQNVFGLSWTSRNGFVLLGCALTLLFMSGRRSLDVLRSRPFIFCALAASLGLLLPFAASWIRPVYHPLRTPVLVLPALSVAFSLVLARFSRPGLTALIVALFVLGSVQFSMTTARAADPNPARASLAEVLRRARCGDVVVPAGQAFSEVRYFMRRLGAPACLRTIPVPAEIAAHPGWLDEPSVVARPETIDREADALVATLQPGQRLWVLGRTKGVGHRVLAVLAAALDRRGLGEERLALSGSFFDSVRVYTAPASRREPGQ
jgi:hypothetical protein